MLEGCCFGRTLGRTVRGGVSFKQTAEGSNRINDADVRKKSVPGRQSMHQKLRLVKSLGHME